MKLRIARKILNGPRDADGCLQVRDDRLGRALRRMAKTRTDKETNQWWDATIASMSKTIEFQHYRFDLQLDAIAKKHRMKG